jgi:hypothetical protein
MSEDVALVAGLQAHLVQAVRDRERDMEDGRARERGRRYLERDGRAARDFTHLVVDVVGDAAAVVAENPEISMFVFSVAAFFRGFNPFNYMVNWAIGRVWSFRM